MLSQKQPLKLEPTLEQLCLSIAQLEADYTKQKFLKKEKINPERLEGIKLIERLAKNILALNHPNQRDELIGLLLFELIKLEHKCALWSGDNGVLSDLLKKALLISKANPMSEQMRLIYLAQFFNFARDNLQDDWVSDFHYKNKKHFIQSIDVKLKQTIANQRDYINFVLHEAPDYKSFDKNLDTAIKEFDVEFHNRWRTRFSIFKNNDREKSIAIAKLIQESCKTYMRNVRLGNNDETFIKAQEEYISAVRKGLIMLVTVPIYNHSNLSPEGTPLNPGSSFYKKLLSAANINYKALDNNARIIYLKTLLGYLEKKDIDFTSINVELKSIIEDINRSIAEEEIAKKNPVPTFKELYSGMALGCVAKYGIHLLVMYGTAEMAMPNIGSMIVGSAAGPLGIVTFGAAGAILVPKLEKLIQDNIIDPALAAAYDYVLSAIGAYLGQFAIQKMTIAFEVSTNSLAKLLGFYHDLQKFNDGFEEKEEWVKALHDLPNHIVPLQQKQILEKTQSVLAPKFS